MSEKGEFAWQPPGIYRIVYACREGAHIGPTHASAKSARTCTAPRTRRINLRSIRTRNDVSYIVGSGREAIVLVEPARPKAGKPRVRRPARKPGQKARLTDAQILDIRERYAAGEMQRVIGASYGLAQMSVSYIVRGVHYADAPGPIAETSHKGARLALDAQAARTVREGLAAGRTQARLAEIFGVSQSTISAIARNSGYGEAK